MSFPASHTVNNSDVWWFIRKRRWRGKCSANTSQNTLVFSCNVIKGVPRCTKAIFQHCLQRDLKQLHIRAQPRLLLWICSCVCEYGICSHKKTWKAITAEGKTVFAQLEIVQIWWSCKVKAVLCHLALSTATGNDILTLQCFTVWMFLIFNVSIIFTPIITFRLLSHTNKSVASLIKSFKNIQNNMFIKQEMRW